MGTFAKKMNKMKKIERLGKGMSDFHQQIASNMEYFKATTDRLIFQNGFLQAMIEKLIGKEECEKAFEEYREQILADMKQIEDDMKAKADAKNGVPLPEEAPEASVDATVAVSGVEAHGS